MVRPCQVFNDFLGEASVFDAVVHAAEHASGVLDRFLLTHLRAARIQVGHAHTKVVTGNFKSAARTGGGLLEEKNNVLAFKVAVRGTRALQFLEVPGQVKQVADFFRGEIQELQEVTSTKIDRHGVSSLHCENQW